MRAIPEANEKISFRLDIKPRVLGGGGCQSVNVSQFGDKKAVSSKIELRSVIAKNEDAIPREERADAEAEQKSAIRHTEFLAKIK